MSAYLSHFFSGGVDPTWPHAILLTITVLASFAVAAGIIFESPKYSESVHRVAMWAVIGGVAVEAACTITLFVFDEGIGNAQQEKIIVLEKQLKESSDVLMWQLLPRSLGQVIKCQEILRASPAGAAIRILWRSDLADGDIFATAISRCFTDWADPFNRKWEVSIQSVEKLPPAAEKTGVTVISNTLRGPIWMVRQETPADFVAKGLYEGVLFHMGVNLGGYDKTLPDGVIVVAIGQKLP